MTTLNLFIDSLLGHEVRRVVTQVNWKIIKHFLLKNLIECDKKDYKLKGKLIY